MVWEMTNLGSSGRRSVARPLRRRLRLPQATG